MNLTIFTKVPFPNLINPDGNWQGWCQGPSPQATAESPESQEDPSVILMCCCCLSCLLTHLLRLVGRAGSEAVVSAC